MRLVKDLSLINSSVLHLEIIPDDSNISDDPEAFDFDWALIEQKMRYIKIKIDWKYAFQISAGLQRDKLKV